MDAIVNRLQENKQIEIAREILESNGYTVTLKEDIQDDKLAGYNINSPIIFSDVNQFRDFMKEVMSE